MKAARLPRLLTLAIVGSAAAVFMVIYLHPIQSATIAVLTAILWLLLRRGGVKPVGGIFYEMREEDGLLQLVIQARDHVSVDVVGDTVRIVGGGVRELIKLPWAGILKNMNVVNNVVTAIITPARKSSE
jgi:hypothetical protein